MKRKYLDFEDVLSDQRREDEFVEVPLRNGVFRATLFIGFLIAAILFVQLFLMNIVDGSRFLNRAVSNMTDEQLEEAPRGVIVDRFGKLLLHNEPTLKVVLAPRDFPEGTIARRAVLDRIAQIINVPREDLYAEMEKRDWGQSDRIVVKENPSHDEFVELTSENLPGVSIEPSYRRVPEDPFAFSHVLGYTGLVDEKDVKKNENLSIDEKIGRAGLELTYDAELRGVSGKSVFFRDANGKTKEKKSVQKAEQGDILETSIDRDLEMYMYNRLAQGLQEIGRDTGVAVAMNPQNGEILGLVNIPSYDSTNLKAALLDAKNPLFNRAVMGVYNSGSAIKPLVATGVLTEGVVTPSTQILSTGVIEIPNPYNPKLPSKFVDWKAHGWVDVHGALARSSNVYFYEVTGGFQGQKGIGIEKLKIWWQKFRLDQKTGIDLPGEEIGFLPDPAWKEKEKKHPWRVGDTYNVAIGQGDFMITPIELLNYIGAVANGGKFFELHVVKNIKSSEGTVLKTVEPKVLSDISSEIAKALPDVQQGMRDAVQKDYGTAHLLAGLPFPVAAKTGTAQIQNNQKTNAFFVGYAPYNNPQIAVIVLVENSREGGRNTVPIANDIFLWYYKNRLQSQK
jgi:penicillin-binding protein 2